MPEKTDKPCHDHGDRIKEIERDLSDVKLKQATMWEKISGLSDRYIELKESVVDGIARIEQMIGATKREALDYRKERQSLEKEGSRAIEVELSKKITDEVRGAVKELRDDERKESKDFSRQVMMIILTALLGGGGVGGWGGVGRPGRRGGRRG